MQRTQQGSKSDVSHALPRAGPSGRYSFQNDAITLPLAGLSCLPDRRICSWWTLLLLLGVSTALLLLELASRPLPARHWSGACGRACQQLRHAEEISGLCQAPLLDEDVLLGAADVYDDVCHVLHQTCLDQGSIVVFDKRHNPERAGYQMLPVLDMSNIMYNFPSSQGNGDALGSEMSRIPFPDIVIRPGTHLDTHLSSQPFSRCTVPLVMVTNWVTTYGEVIVRVPQRALTWKNANAVGGNVTYVIATPGGLALPAFYTPMLAPVTPLAVTSLADFSTRHPEGTASAATNEGLSRQCFDRVAVCKIAAAQYVNMYAVGQATFAYYALESLPRDPAGFLPAMQDRASFSGLTSFAFKSGAASPSTPGPLRVLIEQRTGEVRNMLQLEELMNGCNGGASMEPSQQYSCRSFTFTDNLRRNIAAARSANVLITIHGSGSNNALFMEEGSALIEIRPYQFGTKASVWANAFMPKVTEQNDYKIRYFGLNIEDPNLSEPGTFEANSIGNPDEFTHLRDRHVRLRWQVLEPVLQLIKGCKTLEDYKRIAEEGRHILDVLPGGILRPEQPNAEDPEEESLASEDTLTARNVAVSERGSNGSAAVAPDGN